MKGLSTAGRVLYAIPMGIFGVEHFMYAKMMTGIVPSYFPHPTVWIYLTGAGLIAACISILINKHTKLACLALAAMLAVFILTLHIPGLSSPEHMQMSLISLLKDVALIGGALIIAAQSENAA
ncbi:MAG: DoxX family protein [Candidatus Margulisiibacteriota bacterium]